MDAGRVQCCHPMVLCSWGWWSRWFTHCQSCFTPLWAYPPTYFLIHSLNHSLTDLVVVCRCAQVEGTLVAAGTLGLLRLCQRLLPCKPEAAELLLRGLQLVPSVDPEVRV
jgi:hypothetical protein